MWKTVAVVEVGAVRVMAVKTRVCVVAARRPVQRRLVVWSGGPGVDMGTRGGQRLDGGRDVRKLPGPVGGNVQQAAGHAAATQLVDVAAEANRHQFWVTGRQPSEGGDVTGVDRGDRLDGNWVVGR